MAKRSKQRAQPQGSIPKNGEPKWPTSADGRPKQFSIPPELVDHILLGSLDDRRVTQDSPLQGDVWVTYARDPGTFVDLLIVPHEDVGVIARSISRGLKLRYREREKETNPRPAPRDRRRSRTASLSHVVNTNLYFDEVIHILVPMTRWWFQLADRIPAVDPERVKKLLLTSPLDPERPDRFSSIESYFALAGLIYWVGKLQRPADERYSSIPIPIGRLPPIDVSEALRRYRPFVDEIVDGVMSSLVNVLAAAKNWYEDDAEIAGSILEVSCNRIVSPALDYSIPTVKGDAVQSIFRVNCKNIVWAVLDSGIDGTHPAFAEPDGKNARVFVRPSTLRESANS